jgi:hypothetical protein
LKQKRNKQTVNNKESIRSGTMEIPLIEKQSEVNRKRSVNNRNLEIFFSFNFIDIKNCDPFE